MNFSFFICDKLISFFSLISLFIREIGENIFDTQICFSSLISELNSIIYIELEDFNIFSIDGLLKSFISIGFLQLTFNYSVRYILIKVFVILSPFAIFSLIDSKTSCFFKSWLKVFLSFLFLQIFISIILLLSFSINSFENDNFNKILLIGCIYSLMHANNIVKDFIGGISTNVSSGINNITNRIFKN